MFAANTYRIRIATAQGNDGLIRLAERNSQPPLTGRVLIGEIGGVAAAALSLADGRVIADAGSDHLVANLRVRAVATWAHNAAPSLGDRMVAALPVWCHLVATPTRSTPHSEELDRELVMAGA